MDDIHNRSRNRRQDRRPRWKQNNAPPKWTSTTTEELEANADHQRLSAQLRSVCTARNLIESPSGMQRRRRVMHDLDAMLAAWSDSLLPGSSSYADIVANPNTKSAAAPTLLSFGSYRLGVHTPDADVDCLVLAPPHVTREDFFGSWVDVLRKEKRVCELHPVASAYTPVIKFEMDAIKIDLIFARVNNTNWLTEQRLKQNSSGTASEESELGEHSEMHVDDSVLVGLDETSVRSVNGVRVAQFLLDMLEGDTTRLDNFRLTLRAVKEWARVHGLYGNVLGLLGGVNWAILVCWVCKRNPEAPPSKLLPIFFRTFANWKWPNPVLLSNQKHPPKGVQPLPIWDPNANFRDAKHLMPIITPCYPPMNSSYNVGEPQIRRLRDELWRASQLCNGILTGANEWDVLFEGNDFFKQHANYLQVNVVGTNEDEFRAWFGLCEARIRLLIAGLESPAVGVRAYPFARFFQRREEDGTYTASFFIALRFAHGANRVDLGPLCSEYLNIINSWEGRRVGMDLTIQLVMKKNLPPFVFADGEELLLEIATDDSDTIAKESETPAPSSSKKKPLDESEHSPSGNISPLKRTRIC